MASKPTLTDFPVPPGASRPVRNAALRVTAPVEHFLHQQTASGLLLLAMAVIALVWANSPWGDSYAHLWHTSITIGIGGWSMTESLHFWINDFLMTFFFLVAGFEIKREMAEGELSDLRRSALPIAAAVGGMLVPALFYYLSYLTFGRLGYDLSGPTANGWGVPMATDIAFAVGVMALLGKRIPAALRILLLALAIIDDVGAILVIAIFYSSNFAVNGLIVVAAGLVVLALFRALGIRPGVSYFLPLMIIWAGLYQAGIHPTIAGVIVGMSTPVKPWLDRDQFLSIARSAIDEFQQETEKNAWSADDLLRPLRRLVVAGREAVAPVVRLQAAFHGVVAFFIMPLFALANAGVSLQGVDFSASASLMVLTGVGVGLALGKPIGVMLVSWILVRLGVVSLPRGVTWPGMLVLGLCAGIGFTMAIFIAELAFRGAPGILGMSKLAILGATAIAGLLAMAIGMLALPKELDPEVAAKSPADVEASTEF